MKKTVLVIFTAAVVLGTACSKSKNDNPAPPPPPPPQASPAIGYWQGNYSTIGVVGTSGYAMLIKPGGVARVYDLDNKSDTSLVPATAKVDAVWTLTGTTLQTSYKSGTKTINTTATLNAAYTNMAGTWGIEGAVKGNITLNK